MRGHHFVIDLPRCTGCGACSIACKDRADAPDDVDLVRIESTETGTFPATALAFRVVHCFHCERPRCAPVCPTHALAQTAGGGVQVDLAACVGCGKCAAACPFGSIAVRADGKIEKCDACVDETAAGRSPVCVRACPMRALHYLAACEPLPGDRVDDPDFQDHGTGPRIQFLCRPERSGHGAT